MDLDDWEDILDFIFDVKGPMFWILLVIFIVCVVVYYCA